jgi:DNA primase
MSYKTTCPKCGGNDFYVTPHNGVGYCFHCTYFERAGESKTVDTELETPVQTIRAFYKKITDYYHSCITPTVRAYLIERGYTDASIAYFKLGYVPDEQRSDLNDSIARDSGLYLNGKPTLGGRISFPYLTQNGSMVVDVRGRALKNDDPIRYKSALGSGHLRGADYPYNYADSSVAHIVTEGEIKAGIASQNGIPAVALPGIVSWKAHLSGTQKQTIVFDSTKDKQKREITFKAVDRLAHKLYNPFVAVLPLRGHDKMDIDLFITTYGVDEFKAIVNNALPYTDWAKLQRRTYVH